MDFYKGDHSNYEPHMEVASKDDWCTQEGDIQNRNNENVSNGRELSNNIQRCFRCSKPLYYDRLSLIQHNLTHLKVILEKLPDEIFQFYEPDQTAFEILERTESSIEINQYRNTDYSDIKSEIEDVQSQNNTDHVFDEETQNKVTVDNNNMELTTRRNQKHIESAVIKFEIEEMNTENSINEFLDVEQLNKNRGTNNYNKSTMERNMQHFFSNMIKFEIDEISMDQIFDIEKSTTDVEHNNNIEPTDTNKEQQHTCNDSIIKYEVEDINLESHSDQVLDVGLNSSIESETKKQLQRLDGAIIKCEIEEIHSDDSMDQFEHIENTKNDIEDNNDNIEKKKRRNCDSAIMKSEIEETTSETSMDSFVDVENPAKQIDVATKHHQQHSNSPIIKSEIEEINSDINTELLDTKKRKKVKKNKEKVAKAKKEPRQCHICKKFLSYKHLGQHISEIHTQDEVKCEICDKAFKCKKNMRAHMKNVHSRAKDKSLKYCGKFKDTLTFCCDHCKNIFYSKDCLQKHMKSVHGKAVNCEICGSRLASELYLSAHMRRVHYDDGKVHSCDICGKIFKSPRYVRVHMKNSHCVSSKRKVSSRKK